MAISKALQTKSRDLLTYIQNYYGKYRIPPTLQEMAKAIYGDSLYAGNLSNYLVKPLIEMGYLYHTSEGEKRKVRDIMLTTRAERFLLSAGEEKVIDA